MPVYEYYCGDCNGVFELLRPVRESSNPQPCPVCDNDSRRLMPTDFAAFVVREGLPRRIPDTGKYWTREGLSDQAETGDLGQTTPAAAAWSKGFATSEDDDIQELRDRRQREIDQLNRDRGGAPEVDVELGQQTADYIQRVQNTQILKKRLKRKSNNELTPRTRTGTHTPSTLARKQPE